MKTVWLKGLTGQAREEMKSSFASGAALRQRLIALMQEKIDTAHKDRITKDAYQNANWAYLQADLCGYERALQEIISLCEKEKG